MRIPAPLVSCGAMAMILAGCQAGASVGPSTSNAPRATSPGPASSYGTSAPTTALPPSATPGASPTPALDVVAVGDAVAASGSLLVEDDGSVSLCTAPIRLMVFAPTDPFCGSAFDSVSLWGLNIGAINLARNVSLRVSDYLTVFGTWNGKGIDATGTQTAERTVSPSRNLPCPPPSGGWKRYDQSVVPDEVTQSLWNRVSAKPDLYSGAWLGQIDDSGQEPIAVGTVGDVAAETDVLGAIYPFNLCVYAVDFSSSDLHHIEQLLGQHRRAWESQIDVTIDRIRVSTRVIDASTADALTPYADAVVVEPTVVRRP